MNTELYYHIQRWFRENRSELSLEDITTLTTTAYGEIIVDVADLEKGGRTLYTDEFLKINYLKSPYNFIKDVFKEYYPLEFEEYQKTPIFYEVNDDILANCVDRGFINSFNQLMPETVFYDDVLRKKTASIVDIIIH